MADSRPQVFGEFALLDQLGHGAAGDVYLARPLDPAHAMPDPLVIKRLHAKYANHDEFMKRFRHEAEIAVCVDSPHVAKVYSVGSANETLYIAMEYVPGFSLSRFLVELSERNQYLPIPAAAEMVISGLVGLHAIHHAKDATGAPLLAVHRDISPKNLLVGEDGLLHLIDLGLGKSTVQDWETGIGTIMGSPGYMAPEQIHARSVDHRADVYAMGVVLFEVLTLRRFVKRDAIPTMLALALSQPFLPPSKLRSDVPESLDLVVKRAVQRNPAARHGSAVELVEAIREAVPERCSKDAMVELFQTLFAKKLAAQRQTLRRLMELPLPEIGLEDHTKTSIFAMRSTTATDLQEEEVRREDRMSGAAFLPPEIVTPEKVAVPREHSTLPPSELSTLTLPPSRAETREAQTALTQMSVTESRPRSMEPLSMGSLTPVSMPEGAVPEVAATLIKAKEPRWVPRLMMALLLVAGALGGLVVGLKLVGSEQPETEPIAVPSIVASAPPAPSAQPSDREELHEPASKSAPAITPRTPAETEPETAAENEAENEAKKEGEPEKTETPPAKPEPAPSHAPSHRAKRASPPSPPPPAPAPVPATAPPESSGDRLDRAAKSLEARATLVRDKLKDGDPRGPAVQRILLDLSMVRASKNSAKALEQLHLLEARLQEIEAAR